MALLGSKDALKLPGFFAAAMWVLLWKKVQSERFVTQTDLTVKHYNVSI